MFNLSHESSSILSPTPEIRNPVISDSGENSYLTRWTQVNFFEQHGTDYSFKRLLDDLKQLDDLMIESQQRLVEDSNFAKVFLLYSEIVAERQKSPLAFRLFFQSESVEEHRLTGPIQFILKLLDYWKLNRKDAVSLLGFEESESEFVVGVLEGNELLRGRDAKDRLSHLFSIRKSLHYFFRDLETENDWLREPQPLLDGRTPMTLLLGGSMEDILLVREYVDSMVGR